MSNSLASLRATPYKIPKGSILIDLSCGHRAIYVRPAPAPGTDAYCRDCGAWRRRKRESKTHAGGAECPAPLSEEVLCWT
jgi:hypothetical protein